MDRRYILIRQKIRSFERN